MAIRTPSSTGILQLGLRVQGSWSEHPQLFDAYGDKSSYDAVLARAQSAREATTAARDRLRAESARLKAIRAEMIAKAKADYDRAIGELKSAVQDAAAGEVAAMHDLSRWANGARYLAKSRALSDATLENDATGRQL